MTKEEFLELEKNIKLPIAFIFYFTKIDNTIYYHKHAIIFRNESIENNLIIINEIENKEDFLCWEYTSEGKKLAQEMIESTQKSWKDNIDKFFK